MALISAAFDGHLLNDARFGDALLMLPEAPFGEANDPDWHASRRLLLGGKQGLDSALRVDGSGGTTGVSVDRITASNELVCLGRLGVGTESPLTQLDVNGNVVRLRTGGNFGGDTEFRAFTDAPAEEQSRAFLSCICDVDEATPCNAASFGFAGREGVAFVSVAGADRLTIDREGRVGIGSNLEALAQPPYALDLKGNQRVGGGQMRVEGGRVSVYGSGAEDVASAEDPAAADASLPLLRVAGVSQQTGGGNLALFSWWSDSNATAFPALSLRAEGHEAGDGRLGVNTEAPEAALHVAEGDVRADRDLRVGRHLESAGTTRCADGLEVEGSPLVARAGASFSIVGDVSSNALYVSPSNGNVGVRLGAGQEPQHALHVNGDIRVTGTYLTPSDERLKRDMRAIPSALEKVLTLSGYTYDMDDHAHSHAQTHEKSRRRTGLSAQELQRVLPEAVTEDPVTGILSVSYGDTAGLMVQAIKELSGLFARASAGGGS